MPRAAILLILVACAVPSADGVDAGPEYREMTMVAARITVDGEPAAGQGGLAIVDAEGEVRRVGVDLANGGDLVLGLEPEPDGATDWVLTMIEPSGWRTRRLAGTIESSIDDGCARVVGRADGLDADLDFCE